jgi:hypothetical protein
MLPMAKAKSLAVYHIEFASSRAQMNCGKTAASAKRDDLLPLALTAFGVDEFSHPKNQPLLILRADYC